MSSYIVCIFELFKNDINCLYACVLACSALALLREQSATSVNEQNSSSTLLSQERLIRRAAGLSHFLSNEVAVALVCSLITVKVAPPSSG